MRLDELLWAIPLAWGPDTADSFKSYRAKGPNPEATGQSIVSTLLIRKYLGGDMIRCRIGQGYRADVHYFNQLENGIWVDVTRSQFLSRSPMHDIKKNPDPSLWQFKDTWHRVDLLERRVEHCLSSTYVGQVPPWMKQTV